MALLDIVTVPDGVLRRKARKVTDFDQDFQALAENMIETMREAPGVGLAAPQVGISQRLIVVEYQENEDVEGEIKSTPKKLFIVANPEIIKGSDEKEMGIEGCLSVPDLVGEVERHSAIIVRGQNRRGQPVKIKAKGWLARIFQHEIDHLDGVLYTDRATRIWKPSPEEEHYITD
jgi:peptide deformylase